MGFTDQQLIDVLPSLRRQCIALTKCADLGEDLCQSAVVKALTHKDTFETGTNLGAWAFTIARNLHYSKMRRGQREVNVSEDGYAAVFNSIPCGGGQIEALELGEAFHHLAALPQDKARIIAAVTLGLSYEEMAKSEAIPIGTAKSRVSRARNELADLRDTKPFGATVAPELAELYKIVAEIKRPSCVDSAPGTVPVTVVPRPVSSLRSSHQESTSSPEVSPTEVTSQQESVINAPVQQPDMIYADEIASRSNVPQETVDRLFLNLDDQKREKGYATLGTPSAITFQLTVHPEAGTMTAATNTYGAEKMIDFLTRRNPVQASKIDFVFELQDAEPRNHPEMTGL